MEKCDTEVTADLIRKSRIEGLQEAANIVRGLNIECPIDEFHVMVHNAANSSIVADILRPIVKRIKELESELTT